MKRLDLKMQIWRFLFRVLCFSFLCFAFLCHFMALLCPSLCRYANRDSTTVLISDILLHWLRLSCLSFSFLHLAFSFFSSSFHFGFVFNGCKLLICIDTNALFCQGFVPKAIKLENFVSELVEAKSLNCFFLLKLKKVRTKFVLIKASLTIKCANVVWCAIFWQLR